MSRLGIEGQEHESSRNGEYCAVEAELLTGRLHSCVSVYSVVTSSARARAGRAARKRVLSCIV